MVIYRPYRR